MRQYLITGMSCASCAAHVEKAVRGVEGVTDVAVNLLTNSMRVTGDAAPDAVIAAVAAAGYGASLPGASSDADTASSLPDKEFFVDRETPRLLRRLIASVILLLPLMYVSMGHMMWNWPLPAAFAENHAAMGFYELALSAVILIINHKFFVSGFSGLAHGAPNMDTLVAMGSAVSFAYSIYGLSALTAAQMRSDAMAVMVHMNDLYFESAAMILALITIGKTLESYSKGRTTDALKDLMELTPRTACVRRGDAEVTVPVEEVSVGDVFLVRPGERVPVDGCVLEGFSAVDESALTGESIPVEKEAGSTVSAATINRSGLLICRAERVGADTTLSQIIRMVSDASATKAPIARTADRISGVFVPSVLGIAALTFLVWILVGQPFGFCLTRAVSVLVISCPCALGLATPVAIMVGSGVGAKRGILFKTAVSLEETGKVHIVALDKTGTVTTGRPEVTDLLPAQGVTEEELLTLAAALEKHSEHPLAYAILEEAGRRDLSFSEVAEFQAVVGGGLTARLGSDILHGGSRRFIETVAALPEELIRREETLTDEGKTPLYFARNGKACGLIAVADRVKPEASDAIRAMRDMGIRVVMLTGDNIRTARAIAREAGVDEVRAELLPQDKEAAVRALAEQGKVAMVGDGINDAPALTRADIGIAIGAGTDVALDAADVVLTKSLLTDVAEAIFLSRRVLRVIRQNLFWALIYNVIGIPLAAGVWYPAFGWTLNPMFCAAAMSVSSVIVVCNALRLNLLKRKKKENETMKKTIEITGMMCEHCEEHVKKALEALPGVTSAKVSHTAGTAVVMMTTMVEDEVLTQAVADAGYEVTAIR